MHGDNVIMEEDTDDDFQLSDPRPEDAQEDRYNYTEIISIIMNT